jgi:nicotinamide riboside kinase
MTVIVNFYGGPSAGKSTMAAQLFGHMKAKRMNVEYVMEFAKDLTWKQSNSIDDQLYITGNQHHALYTLLGQVDYIVTDSPILLALHYMKEGWSKLPSRGLLMIDFERLVLDLYYQYSNINFYVERGDRQFIQAGRNQNEEQSKQIDDHVHGLLSHHGIPFKRVAALDDVIRELKL